tara:strand:- start:519 stop:1994 length:1476 start_codon:yes stop_codon:yes gene_type:complete
MAEIFGYEIKRKAEPKKISFVPPDDEGVGNVINAGGHYGQYIDMDGGQAKNENDQIIKYRDAAMHPEVDAAIEDIVNEAIVTTTAEGPVAIILEDINQPATIKNKIREEFYKIVEMLNMNFQGSDIFRKWYVDGRIYYHKIIDTANPKGGIIELRCIDPLKIKKVREVKKDKDKATGESLVKGTKEYYVFQNQNMNKTNQGLRITKDAIAYCTSGLFSSDHKRVVSYLHKSLKTLNQLKMMEDSLVIYRLSRAPERRIFYIDVGNLPKGKAEEYLKNIMSKYRNKLVYNATTGEIKDHAKQMSMLEDFWLPRREGGRGTEITTLPGGENLGQIDDIVYFQKKLYRSLNVPINRLEQEAQFSLGRASEITRDELKFQKFIDRLRKRFSMLYMDILKTQLVLKGIVTEEEFHEMETFIRIDFMKDTHFAELKESELLRERLGTLREIDEYTGKYFSIDWIRRHVLFQSEKEMEEINKQIEAEAEMAPDDEEEV